VVLPVVQRAGDSAQQQQDSCVAVLRVLEQRWEHTLGLEELRGSMKSVRIYRGARDVHRHCGQHLLRLSGCRVAVRVLRAVDDRAREELDELERLRRALRCRQQRTHVEREHVLKRHQRVVLLHRAESVWQNAAPGRECLAESTGFG
jgi:hypothetical protein